VTLTVLNLLDECTGEINRAVLRSMVHRRAMADYGALTPRSLRQAQRYYASVIAQRKAGWRQRHGLPVKITITTPFGRPAEGVRRSAF
jgi:hypothetical protein